VSLLLIALNAADAQAGAGFAQSFGAEFDVLVLTAGDVPAIGARQVFSVDQADLAPADAMAAMIQGHLGNYTTIAAVSAMWSKDLLARVAGLEDSPMVTDVIAIPAPGQYQRPIVAGSLLATVEVEGAPVFLTIRPAGFAKPEERANGSTYSLAAPGAGQAVRTHKSASQGGRPDLTQAQVVVSGGRPLGDAATFERLIGGLADKLGGAAGATRAAVDSGIASNELQVGQTGKIVAPDLYIAAGISGSTQHMAGMKDSKIIVAINTDGDAAIFQVADYGLVMDLFEALPAIQVALD
jgi:electron transfer flavoprotein alpha subunit